MDGRLKYPRFKRGKTPGDKTPGCNSDCWVASYNPELLMLFDSHINVDYVTSPIAACYIYKVQFMLLDCRASLTSNVSVRHQGCGRYCHVLRQGHQG